MTQLGDVQLREFKEASRKNGIKRKRCIFVACENCRKERWVLKWEWDKGEHKHCHSCGTKYYHNHNPNSAHWGSHNFNWKGGRKIDKGGYILIRVYPGSPYYPMASQGYVREHRLVMARVLGRCLERNEIVHHKDGHVANNDFENLELCVANNHKLSYREGYKRGFADGKALAY